MVYAKINDGVVRFAPREVEIGGETVKFPTEEQILSLGYLPVTFTKQPQIPDGYECEPTWEEASGTVVQGWELVKLPDDIDDAEAFDIIFGGAE